ncbi:MFS transporter [Flexivirga meconopsidis]|uniref:MFS transporter n=1 Tax=Flexivirga meconopsidis TaxID=2977121 RepID=UPI00223F241F|nr:MFS transporter [Flexivirga meconopsidis]
MRLDEEVSGETTVTTKQRPTAGPGNPAQVRNTVLSTWLGTTMEYVDFSLYGLAAGLVFGDIFFPGASPVIAMLAGFSTYAVGFLARPVGAVFFGRLGDRRGRKVVLVMTIALMGGSTTLIGLLPTYAQAGVIAPLLLVLLRLLQGFGAGAELSGGVIMLAESSPVERRGLISSAIALGSNSGILVSSGIWLLVAQLPKEELMSWGWRIPFVCSLLITAAALLIRRYMGESPVFEAVAAESVATNDDRPFRDRNRTFLLMVGLRIAENGPSYLALTFVVGYVSKVLDMNRDLPAQAVFVASVIGFAVIPLTGYATDRWGRRVVYRFFCIALVLYAFPAFALMQTRDPAVVYTMVVLGVCLASLGIFAAQAAYGVELFGTRARYSRMALAKEVGSMLSGGSAPVVASAMLALTGSWWPVAAYFALMAAIGLVATHYAPETRGRDLTLTEDAV